MALIFYLIIGIITFFAFLHAWVNKSYEVNRIIIINRSREDVFGFVRQLKNQPLWMPWFERGKEATFKYSGKDGKLGASFYWKGNRKVGEGMQWIEKIKQRHIFESSVLFIKPLKVRVTTYVGMKDVNPEKTKMVWGVKGHLAFPLSIISLVYSPEKLIGEDLEKGLKNLKQYLES